MDVFSRIGVFCPCHTDALAPLYFGLRRYFRTMARLLYRFQREFPRRKLCGRLAFFFLAGLTTGAYFHRTASPVFPSLMNSTACAAVSIVGLVCVLVLPFLFSVFLVTLGLKQFLPLVAFVKAFCFSFVAVGVFDGYGLGGWLAFPMLMFSDLFCLP